jgi:hypothetical protein
MVFTLMAHIKVSRGDFSLPLWQKALTLHSKLITDHSVPLPEYQVRGLVCPENLDRFLPRVCHQVEINISPNIFEVSLFSEEFGAFE